MTRGACRGLAVALALLGALPAGAETITIAVRTDARPHAWSDGQGVFQGYLWTLCLTAATRAGYQVETRAITSETRTAFTGAQPDTYGMDPAPDMVCDPITLTMDRLRGWTPDQGMPRYRPTPIVFVASSSHAESRSGHDRACRPDRNDAAAPQGQGPARPIVEARRTWLPGIQFWPDAPPKAGAAVWGVIAGTTRAAGGGGDAQRCEFANHKAAAEAFCKGQIDRYYGDIELIRAAIATAGCTETLAHHIATGRNDVRYEPYVLLVSTARPGLADRIVTELHGMFADGTVRRLIRAGFDGAPSEALESLLSLYSIDPSLAAGR